jgi:hypothetical protein
MSTILCLYPLFDCLDPSRVVMVLSDDSVERLFLQAMFLVLLLRSHYLKGIKALVLKVESQPHSREVTPAHFLQDDVSVVQYLTKNEVGG